MATSSRYRLCLPSSAGPRSPLLSRRRLLACLGSLPLFLATACQGLPSPIEFPTATPTGPRALRLAFPGGAIFYNQETFAGAKVAPPQPGWTWDQFLGMAQTLTTSRSEDTQGRWGCQIAPFYPSFETMGWQRDATVAGDDGGSLDLTEQGTVDGMQFLADLTLRQRVSPC